MQTRRTAFGLIAAAAFAGPLARARATTATQDDTPGPDLTALKRAAAAFPQPVRVGDLAHRYLLAPIEAQHVLGRVADPPVLRRADGSLVMAIDRGGVLGFGTTRITMPLSDVALSGYFIVLVGLSTSGLDALPPGSDQDERAISADCIITMGIVGPFH